MSDTNHESLKTILLLYIVVTVFIAKSTSI